MGAPRSFDGGALRPHTKARYGPILARRRAFGARPRGRSPGRGRLRPRLAVVRVVGLAVCRPSRDFGLFGPISPKVGATFT
jgi:hypothetical protein